MAQVTRLVKQKRRKDRVNVYLDGEFAFGLPMTTAVSLRVGQTLSETDIEALQKEDAYEQAKQTALNFITYRPRSIAEVKKNLRGKSFSAESIDQVVARLIELGLLNDETFAKYWVDQRSTFKPRSQMALRAELRQKGVAQEIIDTAVSDIDETAVAYQAAKAKITRWQSLPKDEFRKKAMGFLQRRGFQYQIANETINSLWDALQEEREEHH